MYDNLTVDNHCVSGSCNLSVDCVNLYTLVQ